MYTQPDVETVKERRHFETPCMCQTIKSTQLNKVLTRFKLYKSSLSELNTQPLTKTQNWRL